MAHQEVDSIGSCAPLTSLSAYRPAKGIDLRESCGPENAVRDPLENLLIRISRKDQAALAELHRRTSARLFSVALDVLRHFSNAEEALNDVYCQVWHSAARYDPSRGTVLMWLLMLCRSRAIDQKRAVSLRSRNLTQFNEEVDAPVTSGPEDYLESEQRISQIYSALHSLPPVRQEFVELHFFGV